MDNFKGQVTASVNALLEENDIYACLLPPNTTDRLQPLDVSVNKPAKDFLRRKFEEWYTEQVIKQLDGQDPDMGEDLEIEASDDDDDDEFCSESDSEHSQRDENGSVSSNSEFSSDSETDSDLED